jgi:serine/threonine protein kinase
MQLYSPGPTGPGRAAPKDIGSENGYTMRETMIRVAHRTCLAATAGIALLGPWQAQAASPYSILAQYRQRESDNTWIWIVAGIVALGLGIAFYKKRGMPSLGGGKKKGRVVIGDQQIDTYRLLNLMMTGQTSQVWESTELSSGRHFAIKMLLPEHARSPMQRHYLFHEYRVGKQVTHPKVIKMLDLRRDPEHPYVIMEFFPSTNLKLRLMHKDPFARENLKEIIEQTATALAYMHSKGWVHRDVKPDNVLVASSGEVRLIDFALAQRMRKRKKNLFGRMKKSGRAQGTRSYMSPEQIRAEALDARADIYSLGITIYELLTYRPPFRAASAQDLLVKQLYEKPASPVQYNPDVSPEMADLILKMLEKKPEDRPPDMEAFLMQFRKIPIFKQAVVKKVQS